jgi:hypothetical protein
MREIWKAIPGFDGYEASSLGRIRSSKRNYLGGKKIMSPADNGHGYLYVNLYQDGKSKKMYLQELVLRAFVGERPANYQAAHVNGIRDDNRVGNLVWVSALENSRHKALHGMYENDGTRSPAFIGSEQLTREIAVLVGRGLDPRKVKREPVIIPDDKRLAGPWRNPQVA